MGDGHGRAGNDGPRHRVHNEHPGLLVHELLQRRRHAGILTMHRRSVRVWREWALGQSSIIYGFFIRPIPSEAPSDFLDYQTKTNLRLPFNDLWDVVWGGRSIQDNYHAAYSDQRFASDFLIIKNGFTHIGDGATNEDYYCLNVMGEHHEHTEHGNQKSSSIF